MQSPEQTEPTLNVMPSVRATALGIDVTFASSCLLLVLTLLVFFLLDSISPWSVFRVFLPPFAICGSTANPVLRTWHVVRRDGSLVLIRRAMTP